MSAFLVVVALHFSPLYRLDPTIPNHGGALRMSPLWALVVAAVWCLLSLYRAVLLARSATRLYRISRRAVPAACDPACTALLNSGRRPVQLCLSQDIDRPSVIGFFSPRILLPAALLAELSSAELEQVILHEMEHLRRADDWTNLVQKLVLVLFPINPVLLWIEHRLCSERELACDDGVLRRTRARKAYARCLAHLAEHSVLRRGATLALGAWERKTELSRRVYRILRQPDAAFTTSPARWVVGLLAVGLVAGAGELARSPQLVRFAPEAQMQAQMQAGTANVVIAPVSYSKIDSQVDAGIEPAHLALAKAVLPDSQAAAKPGASRRTRSTLQAQSTHRTRATVRATAWQAAPGHARWLVLTSSETTSARPQMSLRLIVQPDISPLYAAVPVVNGWLIIQL
jgi:hypothetical protein